MVERLTSQPANNVNRSDNIPESDLELHQLNPEELERQLEESDLQQLIEKHGGKSRKEASHQATKLITEKRLLRSQAEELIIRSWLPEDLMNLVHSYVDTHFRETKSIVNSPEAVSAAKCISEDEMVIRLWTVEQTLIQMKFSAEQARSAIGNLVAREFSGVPIAVAGKDSMWGLNECLDWLALTCEAAALPDYEVKDSVARPGMSRTSLETHDLSNIGTNFLRL